MITANLKILLTLLMLGSALCFYNAYLCIDALMDYLFYLTAGICLSALGLAIYELEWGNQE